MNDMTEAASIARDASLPAPSRKRARRKVLVATTIAVVLAAAGVGYILAPQRSERTDNAYLRADETTVAPQVRGRVSEVVVRDNQKVSAGDTLVRIDSEEFAARLAQARADEQTALAAVEAAAAALVILDAEARVASSNTKVVEAGIRSAQTQRSRAMADDGRFARLAETGAVARREAESSHAAFVGAQADLDRSEAALVASRDQEALVRSRRSGAQAALSQAQAALARARASLDLARQDQSHAVITAAIDGTVGALQVRVGDYVQPGSRLMSIVPLKSVYVVAYFKETQTARMHAGQAAQVQLDAMPGIDLAGHVDSLAPGTGSAFAFLPFEPGTGNFTKIVQRVPVRIALEPASGEAVLRPGLSATVTVDLGR